MRKSSDVKEEMPKKVFRQKRRGADLAEYTLATALICLAVAGTAQALPPIILAFFGDTIGSPTSAAPFAG